MLEQRFRGEQQCAHHFLKTLLLEDRRFIHHRIDIRIVDKRKPVNGEVSLQHGFARMLHHMFTVDLGDDGMFGKDVVDVLLAVVLVKLPEDVGDAAEGDRKSEQYGQQNGIAPHLTSL